jgi:signal transduction histidine kinase
MGHPSAPHPDSLTTIMGTPPVVTTLHEVIRANADAIVDAFVRKARQHDLPPRDAAQTDVVDALHGYVHAVASDLQRGRRESTDESAKAHGQQRWYAGYDLKSVILEYGVFRSAIIETVESTGYTMTSREVDAVANILYAGAAEAAVEFTTRATEQINDALAIAEAAVRAREDVVAIVSHDLKNPLSVIHGSVALLDQMLSKEDLSAVRASMQKSANRIGRSVGRMHALITDLLDLAKIKAGGVVIDVKDEQTGPMLEEALQQAAPLAEPRSIRLRVEEGGPATVTCDRERLMQVFDNVIGNAIKFSPDGTSVLVRVEGSDAECTFSVHDAGPGIPADQIPMLFDRFWRGARTTATTGTGLGLAIAKGIIEAHRGRIWVESAVGKGTSFFFTLPMRVGVTLSEEADGSKGQSG